MKKITLESSLDWAETLKMLADETRLHIIHELLKHELSVNEIANALEVKAYNISRHLKLLESNGLVEHRKEGTNRIYEISRILRRHYSEKNQVLDLGCCKFEFNMLKK